MRTADELGNLSRLSNVVSIDPPGPRDIFTNGAESGLAGWEASGLWHISKRRSFAGTYSFWYGDESSGTYETPGAANQGTLLSPIIDLRGVSSPRLTWREYVDVESLGMYDLLRIEVFDVDHPDLVLGATKTSTRTPAFQSRLLDLTGFGDRRIRIRFSFDTADAASNRGEGWFLDDIRVFGEASPTPPPSAGQLLINEILADPPSGYDANRDGTASTTSDEFLELLNIGGTPLDLSGATISDSTGLRRTLPPNTSLLPNAVLVIFGPLGLNNDGDTITIRHPSGEALTSATYGAEGGDDQSLTRATDGDSTPFVKHRTLAPSPASPGTRSNGQPF
jgi:hypothetical protein